MQKPSNRKIRKFLINPKFQIAFLTINVVLSVSFSLVFWLAVKKSFSEFKEMGRSAALPPNHVFFTFIEKQESNLNMTMLFAFLLIFSIGLLFSLWFSHRIAGPIHRLCNALEEMQKNKKLKAITFRKNDFFLEIPEAFNNMTTEVQNTSMVDQ